MKETEFKKIVDSFKEKNEAKEEWVSELLNNKACYKHIKKALVSDPDKKVFLHLIHILSRSLYILETDYVELFRSLYNKTKEKGDKEVIYELIENIGTVCDQNDIPQPNFEDLLLDALKEFSKEERLLYVILNSIWLVEIPNAEKILKKYQNHDSLDVQETVNRGLKYLKEKEKKNH